MSYNLRYYIPWNADILNGVQNSGFIYIYQLDGTDPSEGLDLAADGLIINCNFNDWNEPILEQNAQIAIINNKSDFFDLLPLLTSEEREYKISIIQNSPSEYKLFEGYLNSDTIEQTYLENRPIRLVASNYIGKLQYVSPPSIETLRTQSIIDTISDTLKLTGGDSSIFVNMTLCPSGVTKQSNNSALNLVSHETEIFWKNNIERDNGEEILKKLLKPFDSHIYWWDGNWYIERYDDLYKFPQKYVKYRTDVSYGYASYGTSFQRADTSTDIWSLKHINTNQLLTVIPGLNKIEIKLNTERYNSLVDNYWDPIIDSSAETQLPYPYGTWLHWKEKTGVIFGFDVYSFYSNSGEINGITNTFKRNNPPVSTGPLGTQDPCTHGAWTSFRMTVPDKAAGKTNLNINWKWTPGSSVSKTTTYKLGYLVEIRDHESTGGLYLKYDTNSGKWFTIPSRKTGLNIVNVDGSTLEYPYVKEMSASIPMLDISTSAFSSLEGNYVIVFTICPTNTIAGIIPFEYYGDVTVQVSQPEQENLITGIVNNKFINKKTIDLNLFDINTFNYRNGLWTFADSAQRFTGYWYDDTSVYDPLTDKLLKGKFKLFQKSRQSISSTVRTTEYLKPLSAWYDSNQNKKFVLVGYSYIPTKNEYQCVWNEFDNDTSVNLNNV